MSAIFNPGLATGKHTDHQALARQIAAFVDADTTEPEQSNRDAWKSDHALRELEKPVGYDAGQWDRYTDICSRAASLVKNPSGKTLLLLAQFNGERRAEDPNVALIKQLIGKSKTLIDLLESGPRKDRLWSLRDYHIGIWCRHIGDYLLAAQQQDESASRARALGDMPGASIAHLCAAVERFNHALAAGVVSDEIFIELDAAAKQVVSTCTDNDTTQIRWRLYNAPAHVLLAHIWTDKPLAQNESSFWMNLLTEHPNTTENYKPLVTAIQAGLAYLANQRSEAYRLASEVVSADKQTLMTAHLILARLAADTHLRIIDEFGGEMHQLRRFARRILAGDASVLPTERTYAP